MIGRGALCAGRSSTERSCGRHRRENAGISSARHARNMPVDSLRFPGEGSSAQGKSGPKPRTEGRRRWITGGDSSTAFMSDALTQKDSMSRLMVEPVQAVRRFSSEVRTARLERDVERN